ncbi:MAG: hypothetical protein GY950_27965 [bacterium]|nr:hypothetical protein [bacterium]
MPEESEKPFDFGEGGKYRDWVLKFLRYFKDSEMVRHHMISYFRAYVIENEELIKRDIEIAEQEASEQL